MAPPPPIEVRGLVKRYGELTAVAGVDLTVNVGDVYGYLGPNGAGKTTSLRMMLGLIRPTAGSVRLFGRDPMASVDALRGRRRVRRGADVLPVPERPAQPRAARRVRRRRRADADRPRRSRPSSSPTARATASAATRTGCASGSGSRPRCCATRRLLLLDEPATGLDPAGMRDMRLLIRRLADQGMTVLLSSHLLTEVEEVCNRVAIVRSGAIVYEGEIADLKRGAGHVLPARDHRRRARAGGLPRAARDRARCAREHDEIVLHRRRGGRRRALAGAGRGRRADPARWRRRR